MLALEILAEAALTLSKLDPTEIVDPPESMLRIAFAPSPTFVKSTIGRITGSEETFSSSKPLMLEIDARTEFNACWLTSELALVTAEE